MKIRPATPLDAEQLALIESTQPHAAQWGVKGWAGEIISTASWVWCYEKDGEVLGFLALRLAAGFCEILNFAVHPKVCRQGVGFRLLSRALSFVQASGGSTVTLEVCIHNRAALSLYEKAGFKAQGRRANFYGEGQDALIMGLNL